MAIEITARHMEATPEVQTYARGKAEDLFESFSMLEYVHVILDTEKHRNTAEVVVQAKNRIRSEADATSDNMRKSIDEAFDRAEKQLRKLRDKAQERRSRLRVSELEVGDEQEVESVDEVPKE